MGGIEPLPDDEGIAMAEVDFSDHRSAQRWFEGQTPQMRSAVASRAALRVAANLCLYDHERDTFPNVAFPVVRCLLTSAVRGFGRSTDVGSLNAAAASAARSASAAIRSAYPGDEIADAPGARAADHSASSAAQSAGSDALSAWHATSSAKESALFAAELASYAVKNVRSSPHSVDTARSAAIYAISRDALVREPLARGNPLWGDIDVPPAIAANHEKFVSMLSEAPHWAFWRGWYLAMWDGTFDDWDLAVEVAKIPDEVWNEGPEAVASQIQAIEASYLSSLTPLAETIELNAETGRFRTVPVEIENPQLTAILISRAEDALEDSLHARNGLNANSYEYRALRRTFDRYASDPQRVEMDFTSVAVSLRRQIHETEELADNGENLNLLDTLEEGARGIRGTHQEIARNREMLAQQKWKELSEEDRKMLEDAQPLLVAISEDALAEDFAADIPRLINDAIGPLPTGAPRLPGADSATRIFGRASRMSERYIHLTAKGAKLFDSNSTKSVRLVMTFGGVAGALYAIVRIGLRLLGVL